MPKPGILLCGVDATFDDEEPVVIGRITGCTGFGASRQAVPNIHNDLTNGWAEQLLSCIKMMKPFRITVVHETNVTTWKDNIEAPLRDLAITWPVEDGFTTGAVYSFSAAVTDYEAGAPDIESRVNASMTVTISGEVTITPGTPVTP